MPDSKRNCIHPRDEIMRAMERIYRYRMTTTSGGNLSIREPDGSTWITPARVDKGSLTRSDIVLVDPDNRSSGPHPPSSEFPFHQAIYRARPDIRAIVHAHPVALVAFSICRKVPNTRIFHQAYFMGGKVGFAPYALPGSEELGSNIAAQFANGCDSVVLENHGVVVGGSSLSHAFQRFEALEFASKTLIKAQHLGSIRFLSEQELAIANTRRVSSNVMTPKTPSHLELECRKQLIDFIKRGCRQRLLISTEGSYSARISDDSFLITPSQQDREDLGVDDLVLVEGGAHEEGKTPSRASELHRQLYSRYPEIRSIVFAHPVNATAFSITDSNLDARTIPESYLFLREVPRIPYGTQYGTNSTDASGGESPRSIISDFISPKNPAGIVENDGVVVMGTSILDAFDRLEVFESTAEAIINARSIGEVCSMPDQVIDELRRAFKLD
ncbi:class II aldolase/adducin family protein [Pirellulaceae bacterium SH501]